MLGSGDGRRRTRAAALSVIAAATLASLVLHLSGIERNLPDSLEPDEYFLLRPAIAIAARADFDPHWFGYPGSTVIYPLGALLHVQQAALHDGPWLRADPAIDDAYRAGDIARFARTGRALSIAYGVASVALAAWIAWQCYGPTAAALAALCTAFSPVAIEFGQPLRSDSAATFFGLLYLGLVLRALARPSARRLALAGGALGLAVATRLLMASTGLVLAAAELHLLRDPIRRRSLPVRTMLATWLAVPLSFVAVTPYVVLAPLEVWRSVAVQTTEQATHLGADRLGVLGNLGFYLLSAIPQAIGWPQYVLALLAVCSLWSSRHDATALLALYVASFVVGMSALGVHWQRWTLPALPVLAVLASGGAVGVARAIVRATPRLRGAGAGVICAAAVLCLASPAGEAVRVARAFAAPSTEVAALDWVLANVPEGAAIAFEPYTAPLDAARARTKHYKLLVTPTLAARSLESYRAEGWQYLLASSGIVGRYTREPERHPAEVAFYHRLWRAGTVVHKVGPAAGRRGPLVTIFRLDGAPARPGD